MPVEDYTPGDDVRQRTEPMYDSTEDDNVNDTDDPGDTDARPVEMYSDEEKETFFVDAREEG